VLRRSRALAVAFAVAGVAALAAPAQGAAGVFLYTDTATGLPGALVAPEEMKCIAAQGTGAYNYTGSDVTLYSDTECKRFLLALVPGESLALPFDSVGFSPAGSAAYPRP
jgi:hypothetical protein